MLQLFFSDRIECLFTYFLDVCHFCYCMFVFVLCSLLHLPQCASYLKNTKQQPHVCIVPPAVVATKGTVKSRLRE